MSLAAIILLILLGIFLFIVEFLLVPGVTIAGIGGAILLGLSVYLAYSYHGNITGNITLLGTLLFSVGTIAISLRARTWKRLMLNNNIDGRFEVGLEGDRIKPGDHGISVTRMNPVGKVMIGDIVVEGKSNSGFLNQQTKIEIVKVLQTQVIVKPIKEE